MTPKLTARVAAFIRTAFGRTACGHIAFGRVAVGAIALAAAGLLVPPGAVGTARAAGNDFSLSGVNPSDVPDLIEELGVVIAYNPVAPAEPRGLVGFDAGVSVSMVSIDNNLWNQAVADGDAPSSLPVPRLHLQKGLPFGIDIGLMYIQVPSSNVSVIGGEVRKAILKGGAATPAVSVSGHYSRLNGVDQLDLYTGGVGIAVSKGFLIFTPYAGIDQLWINGDEKAGLLIGESDSSVVRTQVGLKIALLPILNIVGQADFSKVNMYTVRLNLGL
jgi:hypothetical protein